MTHQIDKVPAECEECQDERAQMLEHGHMQVTANEITEEEHARAVADALYAAAVEAFGENPMAALLNIPHEAVEHCSPMVALQDALRRQMEGRDGK